MNRRSRNPFTAAILILLALFFGAASRPVRADSYNASRATASISKGIFNGGASHFAGYLNDGKLTVTGGTFSSSIAGLVNRGMVTILGGAFAGNTSGLQNAAGGRAEIHGGAFTGNSGPDIDNDAGGVVIIYGRCFAGSDIPLSGFGDLPIGSGSVMVTFANKTTETLTYNNRGVIHLVPANPEPLSNAPEMSSMAGLCVAGLGLVTMLLSAMFKRRTT